MSARNAPPSSPSSRAHSPALKRSSTLVSTMKRRSCSGEERSSSSVSAPNRSAPESWSSTSATSSPNRRRSAARYSAAGQPSVRASSAAASPGASASPSRSPRKRSASPAAKRRSSVRTSSTSPRIRARARPGSGSSRREAISTWCEAGSRDEHPVQRVVRRLVHQVQVVEHQGERRAPRRGCPAARSARRCAGRPPALPPRPAPASTSTSSASAVSTAAHSRGPRSSSSSCTHATRSQRAAHCASSVLFPNPAGAVTLTTRAPLVAIASSRRERSRCSSRSSGRWNFVRGKTAVGAVTAGILSCAAAFQQGHSVESPGVILSRGMCGHPSRPHRVGA